MRVTIAIDGPAGAGKSTIAKMLARRFDLMYINTGAMYRAVALMSLRRGIASTDICSICDLVDSLEMHFEKDNLIVNDEDVSEEITHPNISNNVSCYAAISEVREKLVTLQKKMAQKYDVVMDGRDIGTVVLKDALLKFYLTASAEKRAERRFNELVVKGIEVKYEDILRDIIRRDYIDSNREVNPLRMAEDALLIDSSYLSIEEVVDLMSKYINDRISAM